MAETIVPLQKGLDRTSFSCGNAVLDRYFHRKVSQDLKAKMCTCFVRINDKDATIQGYYTLSGASISRNLIPEPFSKKLPRYSDLPVTLLGRLAIDLRFQGKGIGEILLIDAIKKSLDVSLTSIGSMAVIVDPIDEAAKKFYLKYGFIELPDSGKMFLPMKTIEELFNSSA